jgi:hypothetical protein
MRVGTGVEENDRPAARLGAARLSHDAKQQGFGAEANRPLMERSDARMLVARKLQDVGRRV